MLDLKVFLPKKMDGFLGGVWRVPVEERLDICREEGSWRSEPKGRTSMGKKRWVGQCM